MAPTTVGDKRIVATQTLLLADDELGRFEVDVGAGTVIPVTIKFTAPESTEPEGRWQFEDGRFALVFRGWDYPNGSGQRAAQRIGDWRGEPLGFKMAYQRLGELNCVTLQFYLGGSYE
jgi:hypothetical protein